MPVPIHDLESVIRAAERDVEVDAMCQVLVTIDTRTGKLIKRRWHLWGRSTDKSYLVTNSSNEAAVAVRRDVLVQLTEFTVDWNVDLRLDYEARCPPGNEEKLATALWHGANPQERLDALLRGWIQELLSVSDPDLVRDFDRLASHACEALRTRALENVGVTLAARLRLEIGDRLKPLQIDSVNLPVRVSDWEGKLNIEVAADFPVRPESERLAYLNRGRQTQLRQDLLQAITQHMAQEITLQGFYAELQTSVKAELERRLDALLATHGRCIGYLNLIGCPFPGIVDFQKIEYEFDYQLAEYPKPVHVKTELLVQLVDLGSYARAGRPDLADWTRRKLREAVEKCLFGVTYAKLSLDLELRKGEIETWMRCEAKSIGYELKQLITITDLEFDILRRPFVVTLEAEFPTRLARLKVRLGIEATLRIDDPRRVAEPLNRRQDVRQIIRDAMENALRQKLHEVDPESFYMAFEVSSSPGFPSVRRQLEAEVRRVVQEEFQADLLNISCKQLETEISELLARLMSDEWTFEVTVLQSTGGPPIEYEGGFRVLGVDPEGWAVFQASMPTPEVLINCAQRHLRQILADFSLAAMLKTRNEQQRDEVDTWIRKRIRDEYGLTVKVWDWLRRPSEIEDLAAMARISQARDTIEEQIALIEHSEGQRDLYIHLQLDAAEKRVEKQRLLEEELERCLRTGDIERERVLRDQIKELHVRQDEAFHAAASDRSRSLNTHVNAALAELTGGAEPTPEHMTGRLPSGGELEP